MLRLHLGCGPIHLDGFVNIDICQQASVNRVLDYLQLDQAYPENSADMIYSCHSLEHVPFSEGTSKALAQWFKALRSGGVLRVVVPDFKKVAQKYCQGESLADIYGAGKHFVGDIDCGATRFLFFCRAWEHTVIFDESLLASMLRGAGFTGIRSLPFGVSDTPELAGIDRFESESLVMEALKP